MLERRFERITYENDKGESVVIDYSHPYFLKDIIGTDGVSSNISSTKGMDQDGISINNLNISERPIQIIGHIKENDKNELGLRRAKLLKVFNPRIKGWLQYEYGNIKKRIRTQVVTAPQFSKPFSIFNALSFMVDLVAPDPYWQDVSQTKSEIALWRGALKFPLELLKEGTKLGFREPSLIVNVFNKGDVTCGIRLQFIALATVVNPSLLNVNTGEYFKINKILNPGDIVEITTSFQNKKVLLKRNGEETNVFNHIDYQSVFLQLDQGDNLFRCDADNGFENLEVSIYHTPRYLGV